MAEWSVKRLFERKPPASMVRINAPVLPNPERTNIYEAKFEKYTAVNHELRLNLFESQFSK